MSASAELQARLDEVGSGCVECGACVKECRFLEHYGTPKKIADSFDTGDAGSLAVPYECSLCGLCSAVCAFGVRPEKLFLEGRREAVRRGAGPMPEHKGLIGYEKAGVSSLLTLRALPEGCRTVFFPGCALSGTRPKAVEWVVEKLREADPALGVVLDCCSKPSHDLGREAFFRDTFEELKNFLVDREVSRVLVACPNCLRIFKDYAPELLVSTVYEELAKLPGAEPDAISGAVIHDPCVLRDFTEVQEAVRALTARSGVAVSERAHARGKTLCCGEGGCVGAVAPDFAEAWGKRTAEEAQGRRIVTYCAGCANLLSARGEVAHVLDVVSDPAVAGGAKAKASKGPVTYLNRLRLKRRLKNAYDLGDMRGRAANPLKTLANFTKAILPLIVLAAIVYGVRAAGVGEYLDEEKLRGLIEGYGALGPLIYMAIYTVAPALFLPGLPITIVGGILFGPLWGVVYTITSATAGACVAFLVSRYAARGFVEKRLVGSRWKKLDDEVEKNGWKVVAFTRLVPLFPFNLLNYALGLTKIGFWPYAVTTFLAMLPACVAFIVFSSSLLDLLNGKVSPALLAGIALIVAVSLIPLMLRKRKAEAEAGGFKARRRVWTLGASVKAKAKLAAFAVAAWYAWGWLYARYELTLGGYLNVWEFTVKFAQNRFGDGNWKLFAEFLQTAAPVKAVFALSTAALIHAATRPFAPPEFAWAALAGRGAAFGVPLAGAGLFCAAFILYLGARFLFSDIAPLVRSKMGKATDWAYPVSWQIAAALLTAIPPLPLALGAALLGASRLSLRRASTLLAIGCLLRAALTLVIR